MKLVIVESPAKAKTIENILGKGYHVRSCFGHVRDLAKDGEKNTGIEVDNKYKPHYIVPDEKKKVVSDLKKAAKNAEVILATDEDREGEAISWHLQEVLGLKGNKTKRIAFTEITEPAIKEAIDNPRTVNTNLVNAQQARRILDRLVGFELTGLLWKKVRGKLSAGRVQSVAVKLIVEKEREIKEFSADKFFKVSAVFNPKGKKDSFQAELSKNLDSSTTAKEFLEKCLKAVFTVKKVEVKPSLRKPRAPFTTSTLQQLASQRLGYSVSRTMSNAQRLYEAGHITYMRTDSTNISKIALAKIHTFVKKTYGEDYVQTRVFTKKSKSSQEAHEAIRPTYIDKEVATSNKDQQKLYALIRQRTLASQMSDAKVKRTVVTIDISTDSNRDFIAKGETIDFDGFLKLYANNASMKFEENILPPLEEKDVVIPKNITALERMTKPPARYTEASLVKKLEELGIGRPSTYAPTITKITSPTRGYITKETRDGEPVDYKLFTLTAGKIEESIQEEIYGTQKNKLFASDMGKIVTDFLEKNFEDIMKYEFTAGVEDKLDDVAEGNADWIEVLDNYYKPFSSTVEHALDKAERATGERILGKHPKSKRTVLVRMSKYGPVVQIGTEKELKEGEKADYANLMRSQSIESVTMEDALKLFELPKILGKYKDADVIVGRGKYGPYVKVADDYISIRGHDPFTITLKDAKVVIEQKMKEKEPITTYKDKPVTKGKGRFGPFVKWNDMYASISKKSGFEFDTITADQALVLVKEKEKKEAERYIKQWDGEKVSIQKGRWGPFIKLQGSRKYFRLPKSKSGKPLTDKQIKDLSLEDVKKAVKAQQK